MVYLVTDAQTAGVAQGAGLVREIRSPFATLEEAVAQALHDLTLGRLPLRIIDGETGALLWSPEEAQP